MQYKITLIRPN